MRKLLKNSHQILWSGKYINHVVKSRKSFQLKGKSLTKFPQTFLLKKTQFIQIPFENFFPSVHIFWEFFACSSGEENEICSPENLKWAATLSKNNVTRSNNRLSWKEWRRKIEFFVGVFNEDEGCVVKHLPLDFLRLKHVRRWVWSILQQQKMNSMLHCDPLNFCWLRNAPLSRT